MGVICNRCAGPEDDAYQQDFTLLDESFSLEHDREYCRKGEATDEESFFVHLIEKLEEYNEFRSNYRDVNSEAGDIDGLSVEEEFDVGEGTKQLTEKELTDAWQMLRYRQMPHQSVAVQLIRGVAKYYAKQPSLVHIDTPAPGTRIIVVGDLHGHFGDIMHIIDEWGEPKDGLDGTQYMFNGNFVDRGMWGPEVLMCVYCLKLRFPSLVHLNRGNHEDETQNREPGNGFRGDHCRRAWSHQSETMYKHCLASFHQLPLCHVIANEIAVVHGGLPLDPGITLTEIAALDRKHHVPTNRCSILGYMRNQKIKTKRALRDDEGRHIPKGSIGRLAERIGMTARAKVIFQDQQEAFDIEIVGAPELEQDVEICFESEADRLQKRSDRLFTALLWSDPIKSEYDRLAGPNTSRGAGSYFDDRTVDEFLKTNGLRCLVRSHQKRHEGYDREHWSMTGELLTVTVFSASNYPAGVGEPCGNKANIVVLAVQDAAEEEVGCEAANTQPVMLALGKGLAWRESYCGSSLLAMPKMVDDDQVKAQEANAGSQNTRLRVLEQLWLMVYCARPKLLSYFRHIDTEETGTITAQDWVSAMHTCIIPDDHFPWEELSQYLADFDSAGSCHYWVFLARYKNALSLRLEKFWCSYILSQLFDDMGGECKVAEEWDKLDCNKTGQLSYAELCTFFRTHIKTKDFMDDDRVYTLLALLDSNHSGFVDRDRFLKANTQEFLLEQQPSFSFHENDPAFQQCWNYLHAALRALSFARCRVSTMFHALDEDQDGLLNRGQFQTGLKKILGDAVPSFQCWEPLFWRLVDQNSSGCVALQELASALYVHDTSREHELPLSRYPQDS